MSVSLQSAPRSPHPRFRPARVLSRVRGDRLEKCRLTLPLEPAAASCDGDALIHHPLANAEVLVYPDVDVFVL